MRAALARLREAYPTGTVYPTPYRSTSGGPYHRGTHCSGWAMLCSDSAFGNLPWRRVDNPSWEQVRTGDLIRYDNSGNGHVVVVVKKNDEYIKVTESGLNNHARWGGQYFKWWLEEQPGYTLYTRYRNRRSQAKAGGVPHLRSAAQVVSPVLAPVRRFVPILWAGWHPYTLRERNAVSVLLCAAVRNCELHQCIQGGAQRNAEKRCVCFDNSRR